MMEYPFTRPEQQAIEQAAKRLKHVMTDADAEDAAYDIAQDIRQALIDAHKEENNR